MPSGTNLSVCRTPDRCENSRPGRSNYGAKCNGNILLNQAKEKEGVISSGKEISIQFKINLITENYSYFFSRKCNKKDALSILLT